MSDEWNDPKEKLDAVVLAGDRGAYNPVCGENKALLQIEGIPVIAYVISALQRCRYVTRIFVVGPRERILEALETERIGGKGQKEVIVVEQWTSLMDNGWNTFLATLPARGPDGAALLEETLRARYEGKAVLFLGSDMPLLTHYELEEFIEGCDMQRYDYVAGTTPEEALKPYYPEKGTPGIRLAYFYLKDSLERQNNLHMIRVFRVINPQYGQLLGMVFRFCLLHVCRVLGRIPWMPLNRLLRRFLDKDKVAEDIGAILQTRFAMTATTYGGAALDVDDKEQLAVIGSRFHRWRALQEDLHGRRKQPLGEPDDAKQAMP